MATITTGGSGNWSSTTPNAPWPGGTLPTSADDVVVAKNTTLTIDVTTAVANSISCAIGTTGADVGGILACVTSANWKLTLQNGMTGTATSNPSSTGTYAGSVNFDMSGSAYTGEIVLNNANSATDGTGIFNLYGNYQLKGKPKKRHTVINSALTANSTKSVVVADATGWAVGDRLIFATTSAYNATPRTDIVTIATLTPGSGTTATITWTDGVGTSGAVLYDHASNCPVGNFSSNLTFRPGTAYARSAVSVAADTNQQSVDSYVDNVLFSQMRVSGYSQNPFNTQVVRSSRHKALTNCAFYMWDNAYAIFLQYLTGSMARNWNVFYSTRSGASILNYVDNSFFYNPGPDEFYAVFAAEQGIWSTCADLTQRGHKISGLYGTESASAGALRFTAACDVENSDIWSCYMNYINALAKVNATGCRFGSAVFANATQGGASGVVAVPAGGDLTLTDCQFPATVTIGNIGTNGIASKCAIKNKNADPAIQELYQYQSTTVPAVQRNTATVNRSTSSMEFTVNTSIAQDYSLDVLAKAGETIKMLVLVRKSSSPAYGSSTLPKVTVSGLGITPVVVAMSGGTAADAWETLTVQATNSGASDGNFTVTFTAQSTTAGAKAFFSGIPAAPFITRCRHYGYLFNETSPTRTVDPLASANESTAAAYTGMAITWGSSSSTAITASNTFQKLFDYHQAQACLNVGSALALTGAGAAGSPALFALGNVTVSHSAVLNGAGSISLGAYTLATEFASGVNYTYTGGAWSQLTTVPTFSGGTVNLGAAGTYVFTASQPILSMTPAAPGTYVMSGCTFSGTVDLRNTTAHAITVEVPAGTTTTTANNTGGTITVSAPQEYQSVTINGISITSRVQIYDTTHSVELYNGVPGATSKTWADPSPAASTRAIRVRIADVVGATAKNFIEANIGTCAASGAGKDISYLASQTPDTTYNSNAINGPSIYAASGITFTDASPDRVNCNIGGGGVSYPTIYACFVYWNFTAAGIANDFTYINAPDTANYILSGMKIRNTSTVDLTVTGGYGRDATTGSSKDIIDTAGSTGNIFLAPDHVVAYATGSGVTAQNITDIASASASATAPAVLAAAATTPISADAKKMNGAAVIGDGTVGNSWRGAGVSP